MAFNLPHPEIQDGELWWSNGSDAFFAQCRYKTKRQGQSAYDIKDTLIDVDLLRPIFVQRRELVELGLAVPAEGTQQESVLAHQRRVDMRARYAPVD